MATRLVKDNNCPLFYDVPIIPETLLLKSSNYTNFFCRSVHLILLMFQSLLVLAIENGLLGGRAKTVLFWCSIAFHFYGKYLGITFNFIRLSFATALNYLWMGNVCVTYNGWLSTPSKQFFQVSHHLLHMWYFGQKGNCSSLFLLHELLAVYAQGSVGTLRTVV